MAFTEQQKPQPFLRVPAATAWLLAALVIAHLVRIVAPPNLAGAILYNYAFYPARYSPSFLAAHGSDSQTLWDLAVPFASYIFLHANATHLVINCVWLLPFGSIVSRRFGVTMFLVLFFLCGIAGAFAHLVTHWGSMDYVIGASAAISGLMAAGFRIIVLAGARDMDALSAPSGGVLHSPPALAPLFSSRLVLWSVVFLAINVLAGVTGLGAGPGSEPIAWQAHIGGYLAGLILAGPFDAAARHLHLRARVA